MVSPNESVRKKDSYEEMTEKMKSIVDLRAKNPDLTQSEIAELHSDTVPQYVSAVEQEAQDIIQQRRRELLDEDSDVLDKFAEEAEAPGQESSADGKVKTEGGEILLDFSNQYWDERPVRGQLSESQVRYIEELDVTNRVKDILQFKARNTEASISDICNSLGYPKGTISSYLSVHSDKLDKIMELGEEKDMELEEEEVTSDTEIEPSQEETSEVDSQAIQLQLTEKQAREIVFELNGNSDTRTDVINQLGTELTKEILIETLEEIEERGLVVSP